MTDLIKCPNCTIVQKVDLVGIAAGDRPACSNCGSGVVLDLNDAIIPPRDKSFYSKFNRESGSRKNFFRRYWNGDVSLPLSYWVISFLCNIIFFIIANASSSYFNVSAGFNPFKLWAVFAFIWSSFLFIYIWQLIGLWRSAKNYQTIHKFEKRYIFGSLAKFAALSGLANIILTFSTTGGPQFVELSRIAFANDPDIPAYKLSLTQNATELKIEGGFKYGLIEDINRLLAAAPDVKTINLESVGGRIGIAEELFDLIEKRKLNTVTNGKCESACSLAFAAGNNRWLGYNAKLGFHSGAFPGLSKEESANLTNEFIKKIAEKNGTSIAFLRNLQKHDHSSMLYPSKDELLMQKYITSYASQASSSKERIEQLINASNENFIKELPKKIDDVTTIVEMKVQGTKIYILYDVTPEVEIAFSKMDVRLNVIKTSKENFCNDVTLKNEIREGISYNLIYRNNRTKKSFLEIPINAC